MSKKHRKLVGERFTKLLVIKQMESRNNRRYWLCKCDCGKSKIIQSYSLTSGLTKSCGCLQIKYAKEMGKKSSTHGMSYSRIYRIWHDMKNRCQYPKDISYSNYGGRGIKVCKRWQSFINFEKDMGNSYNDNLTLDRIDTNGNYELKNCRWVTKIQQQNNRRNNRIIIFKGVSKTQSQWSRDINISVNVLNARRRLGWSDEKLLTTSVRLRNISNS